MPQSFTLSPSSFKLITHHPLLITFPMHTTLPTLTPGAEPYFQRGGDIGCLCLHGFMASPAEVRWLSEHLAGQGYTVFAPRLPGHGMDFRRMTRSGWRDWYAAALDGLQVLRSQCKQVYGVGHSMGGMLTLLLAAEGLVDGAAVLAAPVMFSSRIMSIAHWLKYVLPYTDQTDRSKLPEIIRMEQTRRGELISGRVRYDRWSTAAVAEIYQLSAVVREHLARIQTPLLLVYAQADETAPPENMQLILNSVRSPILEHHLLNEGGHILPQDIARETVFALTADFIARNSAP